MSRPKERLARAIVMAEAALATAYLDACEDAQEAVDPSALTDVPWTIAYLSKLHAVASVTAAAPAPWHEVRKLILSPDWSIGASNNADH